MLGRSALVLALGVAWWVLAPWLFLVLLPSFALYNRWIVNYGTDIYSVYQFWQVVPEVLGFMLGIFWSAGIFDMLFGRRILESIF